MKKMSVSIAALLLTTALTCPAAIRAQAGTFEDVTSVVTVEVPVHVVKDGVAVRGLEAGNFEIVDGRKKRPVTGFEVIDLVDLTPTEREAGPDVPLVARRHFLFVFDLSFSQPSSIARARVAALDLIKDELHPSDLIAVAIYSLQEGPEILLGFTPDRDQARVAIESLGVSKLVNRVTDPLRFLITAPAAGRFAGEGGGDTGGRAELDRESAIQEHLQDLSIATERANRDIQRNRVLAWSRGFQDLGALLRSVEGRKHVVYLSEGVDSTTITGLIDNDRSRELAEASAGGEIWKIDADERFGSSAGMGTLDQMYEAFLRSDAIVHSVDVGSLRAGPGVEGANRSGREQSLFMVADSTGGELFRNFNDLGEAMEQLLDRTSVTYVLAFQPDGIAWDGEYHKLKVRLKGGPKGARLVHRQGYFAPRPYEATGAEERRLSAADLILKGGDAGPIESSVLAVPFRFEGGEAYVPVLVEINGQDLLAQGPDQLFLEVYGYAMRDDGSVGDYFSQSVGLETAKIEATVRQSGVKFFGSFDLLPGSYTLRILVRDARSGRTSVRTVPVSVPAYDSGEPVLLAPMFPEPMGKWLLIREAAADEQQRGVPYPFMLGDGPYIPAARPVLSATSASGIALVAYNLGEGPVTVDATVIDAAGAPVAGAKVDGVERVASDQPGLDRFKGTFVPGNLTEGEYTLIVRVEGLESSIPFVVQGG